MKRVGAHVSIAGGVKNAPYNAFSIGAKAFALFVKSQLKWFEEPLPATEISEFKNNVEKYGIDKKFILPHGSYLLNIGSPDEQARKLSKNSLLDELKRCRSLGLEYLNIHPGSHLGKISEEKCLENIVNSIDEVLEKVDDITLVIENSSGQGSNMGYKFEHLAYIVNEVKFKERIGVCFDTCHGFTAGYDIRDKVEYEKVMHDFDTIVGFKYLKGVHMNDSKIELGKKVDRHQSIGKGEIGIEAFKYIMNDERFEEIPLILETPDSDCWANEISLLNSFINI